MKDLSAKSKEDVISEFKANAIVFGVLMSINSTSSTSFFKYNSSLCEANYEIINGKQLVWVYFDDNEIHDISDYTNDYKFHEYTVDLACPSPKVNPHNTRLEAFGRYFFSGKWDINDRRNEVVGQAVQFYKQCILNP